MGTGMGSSPSGALAVVSVTVRAIADVSGASSAGAVIVSRSAVGSEGMMTADPEGMGTTDAEVSVTTASEEMVTADSEGVGTTDSAVSITTASVASSGVVWSAVAVVVVKPQATVNTTRKSTIAKAVSCMVQRVGEGRGVKRVSR